MEHPREANIMNICTKPSKLMVSFTCEPLKYKIVSAIIRTMEKGFKYTEDLTFRCKFTSRYLSRSYDRHCSKQDRQCTYNITLKRVRVVIVFMEKKYYMFWVRVCSHSYPACNAHAPYCHRRPAPLYSIFLHLLIRHDFREKLSTIKCVFFATFVSNIFHSKKNSARYRKCR